MDVSKTRTKMGWRSIKGTTVMRLFELDKTSLCNCLHENIYGSIATDFKTSAGMQISQGPFFSSMFCLIKKKPVKFCGSCENRHNAVNWHSKTWSNRIRVSWRIKRNSIFHAKAMHLCKVAYPDARELIMISTVLANDLNGHFHSPTAISNLSDLKCELELTNEDGYVA